MMPADVRDFPVVLASRDGRGASAFVDVAPPLLLSVPDAIEAALIWSTTASLKLPGDPGAVPPSVRFPAPHETVFGIVCLPPRSAERIDLRRSMEGHRVDGTSEDPGMHRSDSIDYQIILSGKADFRLDNGDFRTLGPGSCIVVAGAMHAWKNRYDEPCIYAFIQIGATAESPAEPVGAAAP